MRVGKLAETIKDRNALFDEVGRLEPKLVLGDNNDQVRNLVKKSTYAGVESFTKIGLAENLKNLIEFNGKAPKFKTFTIPEILAFAEFKFEDQELVYTIERKVAGVSLATKRNFDFFDTKLVEIQLEINSIPELGLTETVARRERLKSPEGYEFFKKKLTELLKFWFDNSEIKFPKILDYSTELLNGIHTFELGNAHGEFNFHHIFSDVVSGQVSVIDWERFSQATLKFFDLQEYMGRLLVFENDFDRVAKLMSKLKQAVAFDKSAFAYSLCHRTLGSVYEGTVDKVLLPISYSDEERILSFIKEVCS